MIRAVALLLWVTSMAHAQDAVQSARERGQQAMSEGHFEQALALFQEAAQHSDDAAILLQIGDAADRLRRDQVALEAYEAYLARVPDAFDRDDIAARVRVLRQTTSAACNPHPQSVLVDWNGGRVVMQRRPMELAQWQDTPGATPGLGRRLTAPN